MAECHYHNDISPGGINYVPSAAPYLKIEAYSKFHRSVRCTWYFAGRVRNGRALAFFFHTTGATLLTCSKHIHVVTYADHLSLFLLGQTPQIVFVVIESFGKITFVGAPWLKRKVLLATRCRSLRKFLPVQASDISFF